MSDGWGAETKAGGKEMPRIANESLSPETLQRFRQTLRQKEEELSIRLSAARAAEVVRRPEEPLDFGDWCQKSHEEWLFLNCNRLEIALLRDIQQALHRLDRGTFGICQECNQPISPRRLEAVPWATFCVPCEERISLLSSRG